MDDDTRALILEFQSAESVLTSHSTFADDEMALADRASQMQLHALQELVRRHSKERVAELLGMSEQGVSEMLRTDPASRVDGETRNVCSDIAERCIAARGKTPSDYRIKDARGPV